MLVIIHIIEICYFFVICSIYLCMCVICVMCVMLYIVGRVYSSFVEKR